MPNSVSHSTAAQLGLALEDFAIVQHVLSTFIPDRPVWAFGSRTFGRARHRSDLDLAVGGAERMNTGLLWEIKDAFDESDLPIEVDVVDLNDITPEFRQRIERDFILIHAGVPTAQAVNA